MGGALDRSRYPADTVHGIGAPGQHIRWSRLAQRMGRRRPFLQQTFASSVKGRTVTVPLNLSKPESHLPFLTRTRPIRARFLLLAAILILAVLPLAAGTKIIHRWVLTGQPIPKLHKILVIGVLENYLIRQEFEDEMEKLLAKSGVHGIKSHMVLPSREEVSEAELRKWIVEGDFDGALVIRPKDVRTETQEVVTSAVVTYYAPPAPYYGFYPYMHMAWGQVYPISSYTKEDTIVRAEFNLYNTKTEKLIWNGETETLHSKDFGKLGKEYAKTIVKQMKKDKVIQKD